MARPHHEVGDRAAKPRDESWLLMRVRGHDPRLEWRGAVEVVHRDDVSEAWRLPFRNIELFPGEALRSVARMPAGVRIAMRTDSHALAGSMRVTGTDGDDCPCVDVVIGDSVMTAPIRSDGRFGPVPLPGDLTDIEIWLPQFGETVVRELELDEDAALMSPTAPAGPRFVVYGSSISQCRRVASPTRTWPAQVARTLGLDLTCLGFGGECHVDQIVADVIGSLDADLVYVCLGINVHGGATYAPRTFLPAVLGFLTRLRAHARRTPIVLASPIAAPTREELPNATGMTLAEIRAQVHAAAHTLRTRGDDLLFPVDGLTLLGTDEAHLLADGVHPTPDGYDRIAERVITTLQDLSLTP